MSRRCGFCKGTAIEPGHDGCDWCDSTGMAGGIQRGSPAIRYTIAELRNGPGSLSTTRYVSALHLDKALEMVTVLSEQLTAQHERHRLVVSALNARITAIEEAKEGVA